jgi:hypothetical protein
MRGTETVKKEVKVTQMPIGKRMNNYDRPDGIFYSENE